MTFLILPNLWSLSEHFLLPTNVCLRDHQLCEQWSHFTYYHRSEGKIHYDFLKYMLLLIFHTSYLFGSSWLMKLWPEKQRYNIARAGATEFAIIDSGNELFAPSASQTTVWSCSWKPSTNEYRRQAGQHDGGCGSRYDLQKNPTLSWGENL